jgi:photosystem II stability/assembly factor-like uncharacterized protein
MPDRIVCVSPNGCDSYRASGPASHLLVATTDGVLLLERSQSDWRVIRHVLDGVHVGALLHDSASGSLFAGAHSGGCYATLDLGQTWELRTKGLHQTNIFTLAARTRNGRTLLYAGTEPAHLFVSSDFGRNWEEVSTLRQVPGRDRWTFPAPPHQGHVKQVTFHPREDATIFVCVEQGALLRSTDDGCTWVEIDSFYNPTKHRFYKDVHRLRISPVDPAVMYLTGGDGFFRTDDAGRSWKQLTDTAMRIAYPDDIHLDPRDPDCVLIAGAQVEPGTWPQTGMANASVMHSSDRGVTWQRSATGLPEPMHGHIAAVSMNAYGEGFELFAGTTDGDLYASYDDGKNWGRIAEALPPIAKGNHSERLPKLTASRVPTHAAPQ